jgi:hypothetical protein
MEHKKEEMKIDYWVSRLKASTFIKILKKSRREKVNGLTYIEVTKPAALLIKWCRRLRISIPPLQKIQPRDSVAGPVLYLSSVRNDKGEVITLDVYHHILALRREIADRFFDSYKTFYFTGKPKHLNFLYACLALQVARDIAPAVYFADYARWKDYDKKEGNPPQNILFLTGSEWSDMVAADLENVVDRVVIERKNRGISRKTRVLKYFLFAFFKVGPVPALKLMGKKGHHHIKKLAPNVRLSGKKIMVPYAMGVSKGQRSDLSYYHASDLKPDQLLIYLRSAAHLPTEEESQWLAENNIPCVINPAVTRAIPGITRWKPSPLAAVFKKEFYGLYILTVGECLRNRNKYPWWLLERLWDIGMEACYWKDFFVSNQVGILVDLYPSEANFVPSYAISEIGGLAVECERSIRFDYCTFIHNEPHHVNFIAGPYSLTQIPEPAFSIFSIQSSSINVDNKLNKIEGLESAGVSKIIVSVFDETANDVFFGDSIRQLYEAVIELLKQDERFFLLIKPKKREILAEFDDLNKEIIRFSEAGRCLVTDWRVTATHAAVHSNIVISVPSTAAFESVSAGARTIVFNPMKSGSRIFYSSGGLNRRVFEDSETMITALKRFADGTDNTIGDCSDIISKVDGFGDGQGARRVGNYLKWCLEALDLGKPQDQVLLEANQRFAREWGADKITDQYSFETLSAPKFRADHG